MRRHVVVLAFAVLLVLLAVFFVSNAQAWPDYSNYVNDTYYKEHWPTTTKRVHHCTDLPRRTRCVAVYDHTGYGRDWRSGALKRALGDFNSDGTYRFKWLRHRGDKILLGSPESLETVYDRAHFASIVIGRGLVTSGGEWEVDVSYGEADGDPTMGDLPDWYAEQGSVSHTAMCFVAVRNRTRHSIEHELGHCMGLSHWPLLENYDCEVIGSVMCALGGARLQPRDFKTLDSLYGHVG